MNEWWKTFFDEDYLRIAGQVFQQVDSTGQAAALWSLLDLSPGCRILDAPCGWGRLSRPLAILGATVLGVDQSDVLLRAAETQRGEVGSDRLRYLRHDLHVPLPEEGFDVACNVFTSFGYGEEEEDLAMFRILRGAVRPGGRIVVETSHRDSFCASLARSSKTSIRMADGTLFLDEPEFDPISGVMNLHWYWSGPMGSGEKHAKWRCYTPTEIVRLLESAGLRLVGAYKSSLPSRRAGRRRKARCHYCTARVKGSKLVAPAESSSCLLEFQASQIATVLCFAIDWLPLHRGRLLCLPGPLHVGDFETRVVQTQKPLS